MRATVAMHQRTIAAITQPSQTWNASRKIASQIPKPIAPTRPTAVAAVPTIATRLRLSVSPGVSVVRSATTRIQDITSELTSVAALRRWSAKIQSSKLNGSSALRRDLLDDVLRDRVDLLV